MVNKDFSGWVCNITFVEGKSPFSTNPARVLVVSMTDDELQLDQGDASATVPAEDIASKQPLYRFSADPEPEPPTP